MYNDTGEREIEAIQASTKTARFCDWRVKGKHFCFCDCGAKLSIMGKTVEVDSHIFRQLCRIKFIR